jgi:cobalt/nickel transport system ATP-binding protein
MTSLFRLNNVEFSFHDSVPSLEAVSFEMQESEQLCILGANGSGKSTLLHLLAGLRFATGGTVEFEGEKLIPSLFKPKSAFRRRFRKRVAFVFQDADSQLFNSTVEDEVAFGPLQIWPEEEALARARDLMVGFGINHLAADPPLALSGGEKRRVALAATLAVDPDIVLMDEPTLSLDAATCDFLEDWMDHFRARPGKTLVLATHDLELAARHCDRGVILTPCHKLQFDGPLHDVLDNHELLYQMNLASRRPRVLKNH